MKRVLVLATTTGYQIRSFGEAAVKLGVRLAFASDRCDRLEDPWWDNAIPIRFYDEVGACEAIVEALRATPPDGILAVGDRPVTVAARVAEAFGLPGNPVAAALASRNKLASREALKAAGLIVPAFRAISVTDDTAALARMFRYPVVVKPLAMSGSRGVIKADDPRQFAEAVSRLRALLAQPDVRVEREPAHGQLLVESFVSGREFAVEGVLTDGVLQVLAIFDKPDPLDGPFFEETIYVTPSREPQPVQDAIAAAVNAGAAAIGLRHGPVHAECRVSDRDVVLLEVAARPIGGLCSKALTFSCGSGDVSLEELLMRHALGEDVRRFARERQASAVMMIPIPDRGVYKSVEGVNEAAQVSCVTDVRITAKPDALLVPLPEGRSYLGFIFARAETSDAAERAVRQAHAKLHFRIDPAITVV
jgi:biotin carboxylase